MTDFPLSELDLSGLPIFPLAQVALFPRAFLPLHIFESRYRAMLEDCMAANRAIVIAQVADPQDLDDDGHPRISLVAGLGRIVERQLLPDGKSNILVEGQARVQIEELPYVPPYRKGRARVLEEIGNVIPDSERLALVSAVSGFVAEVQKRDESFSFEFRAALETSTMADLTAHHLLLNPTVRQAALEELDGRKRIELLIRELVVQRRAFADDTPGMGGYVN